MTCRIHPPPGLMCSHSAESNRMWLGRRLSLGRLNLGDGWCWMHRDMVLALGDGLGDVHGDVQEHPPPGADTAQPLNCARDCTGSQTQGHILQALLSGAHQAVSRMAGTQGVPRELPQQWKCSVIRPGRGEKGRPRGGSSVQSWQEPGALGGRWLSTWNTCWSRGMGENHQHPRPGHPRMRTCAGGSPARVERSVGWADGPEGLSKSGWRKGRER